LERRGDLLLGSPQFWDSITTLAQDLLPDPERAISRDLFVMLAYVWAIQARRDVLHDPYTLLRHIHDRAWLGYTDTPALIQAIRRERPQARSIARMGRYFEEIAAKHCAYLFLPAVSRIERHQAKPPPPMVFKLDTAQAEFGHTSVGAFAREAFALAPQHYRRERDAFLLAVLAVRWGRGTRVVTNQDLLTDIIPELRLLYERPAAALTTVRAAAPHHLGAARIVEMADEVSTIDRALWLDTLFIAQSWYVGPQHFEHGFEMQARSLRELLAQDEP
jgi:hypothetical protein